MQRCNCRDDGQAGAIAAMPGAAVNAVEAPCDVRQVSARDTWTVVAHGQAHSVLVTRHTDIDTRALAGVLERVVDETRNGARQQCVIAQGWPASGLAQLQGRALFLGRSVIKIGCWRRPQIEPPAGATVSQV